MIFAVEAAVADPQSTGTLQQQQAAGWLQLKQDQKTYREAVEPLAPRRRASLRQLERRQQGNLLEEQRRQQTSLRSAGKSKPGVKAQPRVSPLEDISIKKQLDRQRLDMRIQRERLRPFWH